MRIIFVILLGMVSACSSVKERVLSGLKYDIKTGSWVGDNLVLVSLAPGMWVVSQEHTPYQANSLLSDRGDGRYLLVDTPNRPLDAKLLHEWVKARPDFKALVVFNSHFHPDASGSNSYFNSAKVETWATEKTRELQKAKDPLNLATKSVSLNSEGEGTIEGARVYFPGWSHSPDDTVVFFPESRVLFGSCMMKPLDDLGYLEDADLKSWRQALKRVEGRYEATLLVPGHDGFLSLAQIPNTRRLLEARLAPPVTYQRERFHRY